MPQMSPMNWLYLFFMFMILYFMIMIMIFNLIKFMNSNNFYYKNIKKLNYKFLW